MDLSWNQHPRASGKGKSTPRDYLGPTFPLHPDIFIHKSPPGSRPFSLSFSFPCVFSSP